MVSEAVSAATKDDTTLKSRCVPAHCQAESLHRPSPRQQKRRFSFSCFLVFLLFTTLLVFVQLLFEGGGLLAYSPLECELPSGQQRTEIHDLEQQRESYRPRLHFPRTRRRLPRCIIIGARKCGTRALLEFMNLHPSVQRAAEEVHFFDEHYPLGLEWYRRQMPYSFGDQITVEKSPAYFITPQVPGRIKQMDPDVKLLLIVREPVTRLISDYAQMASNRKAKKDQDLASFENLVLNHDGSVNTAYKAVRIGIYSLFLPRWLATFRRSQLHVVDGDNLILQPQQELRKIEKFLEIDHRISSSSFHYNETKGFFCVRNSTAEKCLNDSKGRKHPMVSKDVISVLRRFYEPYNREFFKQVGMFFNWPIS